MNTYSLRVLHGALLLLVCHFAFAQTTAETFESQTNNATTFTSLGKIFSIGSPFYIQGGYPGTGWNGTTTDNKYIDNTNHTVNGSGVDFSIKTQDGSKFSVRSFWLFLSDHNLNQTVSGSVTIIGKIGGATEFTAGPVSSGFATGLGSTNGFSLIDLADFGGSNHSHTVIDELEITTTASYEYVALDALTWTLLDDQIFASEFE